MAASRNLSSEARTGRAPLVARVQELHYFRDVDGREVDFVVTERRRPTLFIECKWGDAPIDAGLRDLKRRFPDVEAWQLSAVGTKNFVTPDGIRASPALALLRRLP